MPVIQAIYDSKIPIITAIGHETDFTLSDFVSDLRAPTPTAAAELATPNVFDIKEKIKENLEQIEYKVAQYFGQRKTELMYLDQRLDRLSPQVKLDLLKSDLKKNTIDLERNYLYQLENKKYRVETLKQVMKSPEDKIRSYKDRRENLYMRLLRNIESIQELKTYKFDILRNSLSALNPLMLMDKGFAVVSKGDRVITSVHDIEVNDQLNIRLKDGSVGASVTKKEVK